MPDAFENYDLAIRSILTANIVADNEESFYPFVDLTPISNASGLSPYSNSESQGNTSITSSMSSSSSPMHMTDDYLNNASVSILGEPYINILVQPMEKFRFRYISEMVGTHGCLLGALAGRRRSKSNVPTAQLCNFSERAVIRCSLVTSDEDRRVPHAHRLVRRLGNNDEDDPHDIEVSSQNDFTAEFNGMGIIHTAKRNVKDEIVRKLRVETLEDRKRSNIKATLSIRDEAEIKAHAEQYQKCINLNSVALCFQGFIKDEYDVIRPITVPVYSNPINNLKSALTGELKICRIDKYTSSCEGGEEVFILVEKVSKKNIKIKFFELNDDDIQIWTDYGRFSELDVHHQYAMVFRTPPYKDLTITSPKEVFIQLERPSDSYCSAAIKFTYKPSDRMIGRKRTRVSHSNSAELVEIAFNQNIPLMNVPLANMSLNNENPEISKEIKKILDDRCSSSEFQEYIADIDLDLLGSYINLVDKTEENLAYDGASSRKDTESFAKNIVIDILKNIKTKPTDTKNIIMNLLKDRTTYGDSPLHHALRYGQKDTVNRILMLMSTLNTDVDTLTNIRNSSGKTPLHYAVLQNQPEITKALLMLGANPNIADHSGQTPLHTAANCPEAAGNVNILLSEKKTNFEAYTDLGWSPLLLAAEAGSYHAVCSLIKAGAEVNNSDMSCGRTVLHIAVEGGHKNIVEFLLKNTKINVNRRNFSGNTALHTAVVTQGAKAREIYALLLKYGADPYIKNHNLPDVKETQVQGIKTEIDSEDNLEECTGESSFDLAKSNKLDVLQLMSDQDDMLIEECKQECKQENIHAEKVWMNSDEEKQLAAILDETKGWKKLIDCLNFDYLLKTFEQSSSNPSLLLLNYIAVQTNISLRDLQNILQNMGEESAAAYIQQILLT
ncbi:hypothetical protein HN011_000943 [Eciton burchellii]|nr:hypothetical protein HN011_000943 [Eciton burchellii]